MVSKFIAAAITSYDPTLLPSVKSVDAIPEAFVTTLVSVSEPPESGVGLLLIR